MSRFENGVACIGSGSEEMRLGPFDTVVLAVGMRKVNDLEQPLTEKGMNVHVIGDAKEPRQIYDAVREGFMIGMTI